MNEESQISHEDNFAHMAIMAMGNYQKQSTRKDYLHLYYYPIENLYALRHQMEQIEKELGTNYFVYTNKYNESACTKRPLAILRWVGETSCLLSNRVWSFGGVTTLR
jgi:hypothetical protein